MKIHEMTYSEIEANVSKGLIKPDEVLDAFYNRIARVEDKVKAFIKIYEREEQFGTTPRVIAIKDNMLIKGKKTTCASKILRNFVAPYDATVIKKLKENSFYIIGKTNMDEFAMGSSTENSAFFPTHNPWSLSKVPGGSSGGSAAAVAAGECPLALGSDTGGSIRQPAAFCGVVGFKPTYGLVSRYGLVAFGSSLDQIGGFGRSVEDVAKLSNIISGKENLDSTSLDYSMGDFTKLLSRPIKGLKLALPKEFISDALDNAIKGKITKIIKMLESEGVVVGEVSMKTIDYAVSIYYIIAPAEASSNLSRYDGVRYGLSKSDASLKHQYMKTRDAGFGTEVKRRIMIGTFTLSAGYYEAYFEKAQRARAKLIKEFNDIFSKYDFIIGPTTPTVAFGIGEKVENPLQMYLQDIYTIPANLTGIPSISLPIGTAEGLPIGMQIMGNRFKDAEVLNLAYAIERMANFDYTGGMKKLDKELGDKYGK